MMRRKEKENRKKRGEYDMMRREEKENRKKRGE